ncbi:hypothetical protein HS7_04160 [Sulfolobales archaeon HS-7]|nr:hypothetical protein HS7_04160 [Sulfolobales archaeon HS-7]
MLQSLIELVLICSSITNPATYLLTPVVVDKLWDTQKDEYVEGIFRKITEKTGVKASKIVITQRGEPNAFAIESWKNEIIVAGGLEKRTSEGELEAILLHEIAHIEKRHSLKRTLLRELILLSSLVILFLNYQVELLLFIMLLLFVTDIEYSKKTELDADRMSAELTKPENLVSAIKKFSVSEPFFSTHPSSEKRVSMIESRVRTSSQS